MTPIVTSIIETYILHYMGIRFIYIYSCEMIHSRNSTLNEC